MKKLAAIYFSGTGNTEYAVRKICDEFSAAGVECAIGSIEEKEGIADFIEAADTVLIGYPIYGSDMPIIMKEFLNGYQSSFNSKKIITLATQVLFSGDGAALAARVLRNRGIEHIAGIHLFMPNNVSDVFKMKNGEENRKILDNADRKIKKCADKILNGKRVKNGGGACSWALGFFVQRWGYRLTLEKKIQKALKIDIALCVKCGECEAVCPMKNITVSEEITTNANCTGCYRCINLCPEKAISLMSKKKPKEQYRGI
jgi:ferredoxin